MLRKALVITSINKPNNVLRKYSRLSKIHNVNFYVIGDKKSPKKFKMNNCKFLNLARQSKLNFHYSKICKKNTYVRKNIGYLLAMKEGAEVIFESDDDNMPKNFFFDKVNSYIRCLILKNKKWINIYSYFSKKKKLFIWPRGYPLDKLKYKSDFKGKKKLIFSPVQQNLSDNDPDVDAIYRLTNKKKKIKFENKIPVALYKNTYSPFNSQNTKWFKSVFPLMYLPTYCSFRSCDIWRGLIAMKILHANSLPISFATSTNYQFRNFHNLIDDFESEIPVYLKSEKIVQILSKTKFPKGNKNIKKSLIIAYKILVKNKIFHKNELKFLNAWIKDINNLNILLN